MEQTYKGKINEFVDWITGDNEITGQNQTDGLKVSGGSIRDLLHDRLKAPFVMKEDVDNNLYRMFSSEDAYQLVIIKNYFVFNIVSHRFMFFFLFEICKYTKISLKIEKKLIHFSPFL